MLDLLFPLTRSLEPKLRRRRIIKQVVCVGGGWLVLISVVIAAELDVVQTPGLKAFSVLVAVLAVPPAFFGGLTFLYELERYRRENKSGC